MSSDLLRIVDGLSREKNIDRETVFQDLEAAMVSAARKAYGQDDEVTVNIDRDTGNITASRFGEAIELKDLGRIAAQTAKQVMIQRIREAERGSILEEFLEKRGQIITGTVTRYEGGALLVNLGRTEGYLPRSEQIPGETHHPGERIRTLILDVREAPHQVKIILSRSHPDLIRRLFELEVPEVAERIIEIRALAREAGYRTKVAVTSIDTRVDAVGACVGVRGSRIKAIVDELGGEKIDIVRWNESSQILITNALRPAEISEIALCLELMRATVVVNDDQLSLAIGKRGQNVRLAARLTNWDIDILTPAEYNKGLDTMEKELGAIEGVDAVVIEKLLAMGMVSVMDVEEVGTEPLIEELGLEPEVAERMVAVAAEAAKRVAAEMEVERAAREAARKAAAEAEAAEGEAAEGEAGTTDEADGGGEAAEALVASPTEPTDSPAASAGEPESLMGEEKGPTVTEAGGADEPPPPAVEGSEAEKVEAGAALVSSSEDEGEVGQEDPSTPESTVETPEPEESRTESLDQ
ncbi:MAG: transcription termination/antitermination protein NusA [Phycisphaerales bacterium]|nr:MAG: transcription termination/antitermination protein NusA [Phycisphaerales bacterium]